MEDQVIELIQLIKDQGIEDEIDHKKFYLYSLITHSTAIEGSTVTEIENQLLFDEGIAAPRPINEQLMNLDLKSAYQYGTTLALEKRPYSKEVIQKLSSLVMKNTGGVYKTALGEFSAANGDLRLLNVSAGFGGRSYMNYAKVETKLEEFCSELNSKRNSLSINDIIEIYKLSFYAHFHLATIHPFADGNGRLARLVMNLIQTEFGVMSTIIRRQAKSQYIEALAFAQQEDNIQIFYDFMFSHHAENLRSMIEVHLRSLD